MSVPADIANQALDSAGIVFSIGDLTEGTRPAQVLLRAYSQCLRQLLRSANWAFARRTEPLMLLADATGSTPDVGTIVPQPFAFEYAYPIDCMKARYIPWNPQGQGAPIPQGNISIPSTPLTTGTVPSVVGQRIRPARFVIATDPNYPVPNGEMTWDVQGVSPQGRTVILCNVRNASLVYTALMTYPSVWDPLFRAAMVAYLASEIAFPLSDDKKFGMQVRAQNIAILKQKLIEARLVDGNESTSSSDISVDWMRTRNSGGGWRGFGGEGGGDAGGWGSHDALTLADGSVF